MQNTTTTGFMNGDRIQESGIHSDHRQGTVKSAQNGGTAVWVSWDEFTTREGHRLESRMGWQCVDHIELVPVEAVEEVKASSYGIILIDAYGNEDSDSRTEDYATMQEAEDTASYRNARPGDAYNEDTWRRVNRGEWVAYRV